MTFAVVLDVTVLLLCTSLLIFQGRLTHSHPAVIYLIFHFLVVTVRAVAVQQGASPLFGGWGPTYEAVNESEISRAVLFADLALVAMTIGCIQGGILGRRRLVRRRLSGHVTVFRPVSLPILTRVALVALLIGTWGLINIARLPGISGAARSQEGFLASGYVTITFAWGGLGLLALIYWYGFRLWLVLPMVSYLLVAALQGGLRFRLIIPLLLLAQISLDRRQRNWPTLKAVVVGVLLLLAFFPLKAIGGEVQQGASLKQIVDSGRSGIGEALSGQSPDQTILDQFAMTLTLVDRADHHFYGKPYLSILTLPVPRFAWPDKPGLADQLEDISTSRRPAAELGMVTTLWGDAYLNFSYFGLLLVPYLLGRILTSFYVAANALPYRSVLHFAYLLVACNLIQVFRDGLVSLPIFVVVQMLPLTIMIVWHRLAVNREPLGPDAIDSHSPSTLAIDQSEGRT